MTIAFHGAAQTVTGSKHLLTLADNKKILLDCGLFQGMGPETDVLNASFGFVAAEVNWLILSHAHIDHSGLIPQLVKEGFKGKIFATPATKDLATVLMADAAGIQENDLKFVNKRRAAEGLPALQPLYSAEDALKAQDYFETIDYNTWFTIAAGIDCCFTDVGHIIGSAAVHLKISQSRKFTPPQF